MNYRQIGIFLMTASIVLLLFFSYFRHHLEQSYMSEIISLNGNECVHTGDMCPFKKINTLLIPTILVGSVLLIMLLFGMYLMFFDKSEQRWKETKEELSEKISDIKSKEIKKMTSDAFLSALDDKEKEIVTALKEEDGIEQSTLRYKLDYSKTQLSMTLTEMEKKKIITKVPYKRTNKIYLNKKF